VATSVQEPQATNPPDGRSASVESERPLRGYAALTGLFSLLAASFAGWMRRSGRQLPERVEIYDLALLSLATHKVSRLIAKDRVTSAVRAPFTRYQEEAGPSEVEEEAVGHGLRRAIGELLVCPYCLSLWIAAAFTAGLIVVPRATRWTAAVFSVLLGADVLHIAYKKAEQTL
jgi:Flp pilus assembly protein TadB